MNALYPPKKLLSRPIRLLGADSAGLLMTPEEFEEIGYEEVDPRYRYELINGVVVVSPPPSDGEANPNGELEFLLRQYKYEHRQGKCLAATMTEREVKTRVGIRRVDRAIWIGYGQRIRSKRDLPTIIVEFVGPGKRAFLRDYEEKRDEYLELGAKEYWVIDRFQKTMTVYFQPPAKLSKRVVAENETYKTPLLPGFKLPLKRLLDLAISDEDDE